MEADTNKTLALMEKYIEFFSLLCLQDFEMLRLNKYYLAVAILCASRAKCKLVQPWRVELVELTGLEAEQFCEYQVKVERTFSELFKEPKPLQQVFYQSPDLHRQKTPDHYLYNQKSSEAVQKTYANNENSPLSSHMDTEASY